MEYQTWFESARTTNHEPRTTMLLFDSLHMAANAMNASQIGMQVAGQNLNNANTPGYIREQLVLETSTPRKLGNGTVLGTGVQVQGVVQVLDRFLEERVRSATSDLYGSAMQEKYYTELETMLNELTEYDLSTSIDEFFNSIDNVLNQPENTSFREMAATQGEKLTQDINKIATSIITRQLEINEDVLKTADDINRLTKEIDELNKDIVRIEAGRSLGTQALGLRDRREAALEELSQIINIKSTEDESGAVTLYCGSDILVANGIRYEVDVRDGGITQNGVIKTELFVKHTGNRLDVRSGALYGMYEGRDTIYGGYADQLDNFTYQLVSKFNAMYTSGQGLTGYTELTALTEISDSTQPLNAENLPFAIENGGFTIQVYNKQTKVTVDHFIPIQVEPLPTVDPFSLNPPPKANGTTLEDIRKAISDIDGLTASINSSGQLQIKSEGGNIEFAFGPDSLGSNDSSGVLAALGINTFFTGNRAATVNINPTVLSDSSKFAASLGGVGHDSDNGVRLAGMVTAQEPDLGNRSIVEYYRGIVSETMLAAGTVKATAASNSLYQDSLVTQRDAIRGVNIDEETIAMMTYQRMFQANSKFVSMIDEMLRTLINM